MNEQFDITRAPDYIGRSIIIDLEVRDDDENAIERRQLFGEIERISAGEGVVVRLAKTGRVYHLPPTFDEFEKLEPGPRRLIPGDEAIDGADLLVRCVVHEPPPEMDVPPVGDLANENPMLERDGHGGYKSVEE